MAQFEPSSIQGSLLGSLEKLRICSQISKETACRVHQCQIIF